MEHTSPSFDSYQQCFQSTPAFHFSHPHHSNASSSSSPATEALVTPRDAQKIMNGKSQDSRRSVRVRQISGGQSSPFIATPSSTTEYRQLLPAPSLRDSASRGRPTQVINRPSPHQDLSQAQAQLQGYTPDQFEQAKLDLVRLLRTESAPSISHHESIDKGKGRSTGLGRSASFDPNNPPGTESNKSIRSRPSLEEIVERSGSRRKQVTDERDTMQWAEFEEETGIENDYEDQRVMESIGNDEQTYRSRVTSRGNPTPYQNRTSHIPNSNFVLTSPAVQYQQLLPRQPLSAHRGMMERFMDDRDPISTQSFESPPLTTIELAPIYEPQSRSHHYSPAINDYRQQEPVHQHSTIFNQSIPTSPRPSRPPQADLLCSPDVARLLRSELDELAAIKSSKKEVSLEGNTDIVRSLFSCLDS